MKRRQFLTNLPAASGVFIASSHSLPAAAQTDPLVPLYHEWLDARRTWRALADLPGNENWDDPRSIEAEERETSAAERMLALTPSSMEGMGVLAALAWSAIGPGGTDSEDYAELIRFNDARAVNAIWKACTGRVGYPDI
ncbi:hypothetical protein [Pararhodobacter sp.]|uniref:hypothetical protein n=1 Tax=Pararhodobacter sp. TaxID=2127056 RepID=UPI002FDCC9FE